MAFVALPSQPLGGDVGAAIAADRLEEVIEVEVEALRQGVVPLDLDVGLFPEGGKAGTLFAGKSLEASGKCSTQCLVGTGGQFVRRGIAAGDDGRHLLQRDGFAGLGRDAEPLGKDAVRLRRLA